MVKKIEEMDDPLAEAVNAEMEAKFSILTAEEIAAAREKARANVTADAKKKAINEIIAAETLRLSIATGDRLMDEEIWISVDLPIGADRLVIDGTTYMHGHLYKRPRHVVNSMREMIARQWDHEADIKGESLRQKIGQYRAKNFGSLPGSHTTAGAPHVGAAA